MLSKQKYSEEAEDGCCNEMCVPITGCLLCDCMWRGAFALIDYALFLRCIATRSPVMSFCHTPKSLYCRYRAVVGIELDTVCVNKEKKVRRVSLKNTLRNAP